MKKIICLLAFCVFVAGCVQNNDDKPATEIEIGVVLASVGDGGDGEVIATPAEVLTEDGVEYGTQVELTAPAAAEGYVFDGWSGDVLSMDNPLVFTIEADTVRLTANYAFLHKVSASVGAGGDGMIVATPAEALTSGVRYGTEIELTAPAAEEGYVFYSWFGDISSTDNPLVFTIEEDVTTLRANYRQEYVVCPAGEVAIELSDGIVIWAGSNLSGYQTFAQNPEDFGCLFHWGYKGVIAGADDTLSGEMLYSSIPDITTWPAGEDPCFRRQPERFEHAPVRGAQRGHGERSRRGEGGCALHLRLQP